jgi:hypothetical protein
MVYVSPTSYKYNIFQSFPEVLTITNEDVNNNNNNNNDQYGDSKVQPNILSFYEKNIKTETQTNFTKYPRGIQIIEVERMSELLSKNTHWIVETLFPFQRDSQHCWESEIWQDLKEVPFSFVILIS